MSELSPNKPEGDRRSLTDLSVPASYANRGRIINPAGELQAVEVAICQRYLQHFGGALTERQRHFLRTPNIQVITPAHYHKLYKENQEQEAAKQTQDIELNGRVYRSYSCNDHELPGGVVFSRTKIPYMLLEQDPKERLVLPEFLVSQDVIDNLPENLINLAVKAMVLRSTSEEDDQISINWEELNDVIDDIWSNTLELSTIALHEKLHAVQNLQLPLPIIEAATYCAVDDCFRACDIQPPQFPEFGPAIERWRELRKEIGVEIDDLVFDSLSEDAMAKELLKQLATHFTPKKLQALFPRVHWDTTESAN